MSCVCVCVCVSSAGGEKGEGSLGESIAFAQGISVARFAQWVECFNTRDDYYLGVNKDQSIEICYRRLIMAVGRRYLQIG